MADKGWNFSGNKSIMRTTSVRDHLCLCGCTQGRFVGCSQRTKAKGLSWASIAHHQCHFSNQSPMSQTYRCSKPGPHLPPQVPSIPAQSFQNSVKEHVWVEFSVLLLRSEYIVMLAQLNLFALLRWEQPAPAKRPCVHPHKHKWSRTDLILIMDSFPAVPCIVPSLIAF